MDEGVFTSEYQQQQMDYCGALTKEAHKRLSKWQTIGAAYWGINFMLGEILCWYMKVPSTAGDFFISLTFALIIMAAFITLPNKLSRLIMKILCICCFLAFFAILACFVRSAALALLFLLINIVTIVVLDNTINASDEYIRLTKTPNNS